jgi:hypothetical protein
MAGLSAETEDGVSVPATGDPPAGGTGSGGRLPEWAYPVTRYLAVLAGLTATVWLSAFHLPGNVAYPGMKPVPFKGDFVLEGWMRWDAGWYAGISRHGYSYTPGQASSVAFFPSYPLAMRAVQAVVQDPSHVLAGILVTIACGLAASVVVYRWSRSVTVSPAATVAQRIAAARTALLVVLLFPYAWYLYGAIYADALFLLAVSAAFLLLERDRPVLAGLVAIVATAGRPVGTGVIIGLVAVVLERRRAVELPFLDSVRDLGWRGAAVLVRERAGGRPGALLAGVLGVRLAPRRLRGRDAGVLLSAAGLGGWMLYLGNVFGNPFLFIDVQSAPGWVQPQGPRTWFKVPWLANLQHLHEYVRHPHEHWDLLVLTLGWTFQALLVLGALCLVPAVIRRVGWGYAAYVIGVVAIPLLGSKDWQGTGRYLLAAFPVYFVVGWWLSGRPRLRVGVLTASAVVLIFLASAFARGFYLA